MPKIWINLEKNLLKRLLSNMEVKIEIYGRVQGVSFRHFVKENADKLGLTGFVRNKDDGSVLVVAQGSKDKLEELLRAVQKGSSLSKVDGVSFRWREESGRYDDFVIALGKGMIEDQASSFLNLGKNIFGVKSVTPKHVAIIPDGNRRWAKKKGLTLNAGHKRAASFENMKSLISEAENLGIEYLTFWAFSTENWKRSDKEVKILFGILEKMFDEVSKEIIEKGIKFRHLGRQDRLPKNLVNKLVDLEYNTKDNESFCLQLCLDYGGRDEILRAVNKILKSGVSEVGEDDIHRHLDSAGVPDPELIIRTSGEKRISGFMPFQSAYAEFYFCDKHFPDFTSEDLRLAVGEFGQRRRRFGGN